MMRYWLLLVLRHEIRGKLWRLLWSRVLCVRRLLRD